MNSSIHPIVILLYDSQYSVTAFHIFDILIDFDDKRERERDKNK